MLAGLALLAVCVWLGKIGKKNGMFYIPMAFMTVATLTSLVMTFIAKLTELLAARARMLLALRCRLYSLRY